MTTWRDSKYLTIRQSYRYCSPPRSAVLLWVARTAALSVLGMALAAGGATVVVLAVRDPNAGAVGVLATLVALVGLIVAVGNLVELVRGVAGLVSRSDPLFTTATKAGKAEEKP